MSDYETVIGLEVHVELATASKLFCGCPNEFGVEPNTNVCPVCLGLPGSLPVLNEKAVEYALRVAEALHLHVPERSVFSRKNYFYPDMPKNYQTSQYDLPFAIDGFIEVDGARIGITRAHLEEDTGKTSHMGGAGRIHGADFSLVDYNRAGVPLLEIVSEPDIRSSDQAKRYVDELRLTLLAVGVSDVKMEEGSMRVDANVSVRPSGSPELGTRAEIKNLNSLRSLVRAIEYEGERQWALVQAGEPVVQETRHWDEASGRTISGRSKEEAHDYRYFPEPDLVPVAPTEEMRAHVRATMPELPAARRARYVREWSIKEEDARILVDVPGLGEYAERAIASLDGGGTAKDVVNWVRQDVLAYVNETGLSPAVLSPEMLAELVALVSAGTISRNQAKDVLDESLREEKWPRDIVEVKGLAQVSDESSLTSAIDAVLAANPGFLEEYRAADDKARKKKRGFIMGEVMKALQGQGNAQVLNRLLDDRLGS
ncbi:MAG TPA: Asp-tRNA(Asn)/Glu-tRNA(Gln) amidotransferase subunit GatB [Acidimicrobiia bacterium]|nr:Asp-tRNA(Asn)/Glu-tRNA(Gln) amidotransferase subunit GatB [Acidimicrobiia bacterium]